MSINDTVNTGLRNAGLTQYADQAAPIVTALVQREEQGIARLIEVAKAEGLSEAKVRAAFNDLGAHVPAEAAAEGGDVERRLSALERTVERAVAFARRNGFPG
jgi:hypothetical protein